MSSIIASVLFFSISLASPLLRRVNQDEHVILANCLDASGIKYSEIAYFPAQASSALTPTIAYVNTPFNTYASWEGNSISATFTSDNDVFTSNVATTGYGEYAGPGSNQYGGFNCFYLPLPNLYIDGPGTQAPFTCSQVYDCSHTPVPAAKPTVEFFLSSSLAQFDGTSASAFDFFAPIYQHINSTSCSTQPVTIPNTGSRITGAADCTISFTCDASGSDGRMIKSLADTLTSVVASLPSILTTKQVPITPYCIQAGPILSTPGGPVPTECAVWSANTKTVSYILSHMSMDITGYFEGGNLEYDISCPAAPQCTFCDMVAGLLADPSKIPIIGSIFGVGELVNKASCANSNCPEPI